MPPLSGLFNLGIVTCPNSQICRKSQLSRWISFFVLVAVIVVISAFFLRVMAEFLVPLFVACILVVLFRPVHLWILSKMPKRPTMAAILTTSAMVLAVVLPTTFLTIFAAAEGNEMVRRFDVAMINRKIQDLRRSFDLEIPRAKELTDLETELSNVRNELFVITKESTGSQSGLVPTSQLILAENKFQEITASANLLRMRLGLRWPEAKEKDPAANPDSGTKPLGGDAEPSKKDKEQSPNKDSKLLIDEDSLQDDGPVIGDNPKESAWFGFVHCLQKTLATIRQLKKKKDQEVSSEYLELESKLNESAADCVSKFRDFKVLFLGGPTLTLVKELVNPKQVDIDRYAESGMEYLTSVLLTIGGTATVFIGRLVVGGMIVVIAFYFFLVDGPGMMQTLMKLSPMDDRHEQELIDEFERVSRAVVLATLAAAVAQGLLAGIGFYFAGVPSVFLLTLLTMVLAMIPFVGAAAVWVPVCGYLFFFENQIVTASVLAIYSMLIVSSADNVIKPLILHGQSNLHPLLALLSVLGGVSALGAIGILIGPMLVVFLQTLLSILRDELIDWDHHTETNGGSLLPAMATGRSSPSHKKSSKRDVNGESSTNLGSRGQAESEPKSKPNESDLEREQRDNVGSNLSIDSKQRKNVSQRSSSKKQTKRRGGRKN